MRARIGVIFLSAVVAGVFGIQGAVALAEDITIGVLVDLSGPNGVIGRMQRDSYLLGLEEINSRGGVGGDLIQLDIRDTGGRPATARSITRHFIDNKQYPLILGGTGSSVTEEVARVSQSRGVPYLAVSGAEDRITRKGYDNVFRITPTLSMYNAGAVQFLRETIGSGRISLIYERSRFASGTISALEEAGKHIGWDLNHLAYDFGVDDFAPLLQRVKELEPDALFIVAYGKDSSRIVTGLRDLEVRPRIVMGGSPSFSERRFLRTTDEAGQGIFFTSLWSPKLPYKGAQAYSSRYRDLYGSLPDYHGAEAFSAIYLLRSVLHRVPSRDPGNIRDALASTMIQTPFGPIGFSSEDGYTNQNMPPTYVQQWIDGEPEIVWPPEFRTAEPVFKKVAGINTDSPQKSP